MPTAPQQRPPIHYGTVEAVHRLSPSMIRLVFGGEGLDGFTPSDTTDQYVNAAFLPDRAPYSVPFDPDVVRELDAELRPRNRRYTIRDWDPARRQLTIDFVAHGDVGYAGRWAQRASVGDRLQMAGPSGGYRPDPTADWHLMVGDESALPAIAASMEVLDDDRRCVVVVVVDGPAKTFAVSSSKRLVHNSTALSMLSQIAQALATSQIKILLLPVDPMMFWNHT